MFFFFFYQRNEETSMKLIAKVQSVIKEVEC